MDREWSRLMGEKFELLHVKFILPLFCPSLWCSCVSVFVCFFFFLVLLIPITLFGYWENPWKMLKQSLKNYENNDLLC
jgi:hypothetical protein